MKYLFVALFVPFFLSGCLGKPKASQESIAAQITSGPDAKLFMGITKDNVTEIKSAIARGANVNALHHGLFAVKCLDKASPLYFAVFCKNAALVKFLLANGANPAIPNCANELPLEQAERKGFSEISVLFEKHYAFPDLPAIDLAVYKNIKKTCLRRWDMKKMKMDTFNVRPERNEYVVDCDGIFEGELYSCVIRANSEGKWINDGRGKRNP